MDGGSQLLIDGFGMFSSRGGFSLQFPGQDRKSDRELKTWESKGLCKGGFITTFCEAGRHLGILSTHLIG